MKANKGIVMSINDDSITLLGSDGIFYSIAHPNHVPLLGEELPIPVQSASKHASRMERWFSTKQIKRWGLVASICLLILTTVMFFPRAAEASYIVALDINPSVELYLDKQYKVIKVVAMSNDATTILQPLKLKGKDLSNAIQEITTQAKVEGFLPQSVERSMIDMQVVATVVRLDASMDEATLVTQVQQQLGTVENEEILIRTTSKETLEQAHKEQLPVYKYEVVQSLESKGINLEQEVIQSHSVGELVEIYNIDPTQLENTSKQKNNDKLNNNKQNNKKEEKEIEKNNKQLEKEEKKQEKNKQKEEKQQNKNNKEEKQQDKQNSMNDNKDQDKLNNNKDNSKNNNDNKNNENKNSEGNKENTIKGNDKNNSKKNETKSDKDNNGNNKDKKGNNQNDKSNKGNNENEKGDNKNNNKNGNKKANDN